MLDALALLGIAHVAIGEAVLVAVRGDVPQGPLGLLEALGLSLAGLFERLAGGIVAERRNPAADSPRFDRRGFRLGLDAGVGSGRAFAHRSSHGRATELRQHLA